MYYAIAKGKKTGIVHTWKECQALVNKYSGAVFKKFSTEQEAMQFLKQHNVSIQGVRTKGVQDDDYDLISYVDGSYNATTHTYGSGVVFLVDGLEKYFVATGTDRSLCSMRNVAGEIAAARHAVEYAIQQNKKHILICYDYLGIENWATETWKTNNPHTEAYAAFMKKSMRKIQIDFRHIKSHTGDKYNDMADKLAKQAAGVLYEQAM